MVSLDEDLEEKPRILAMLEDFIERVTTLLKDKSHGVLICVVQ